MIKEIIVRRLSEGKQLIIALDRTQWQENNMQDGECNLPKTSLSYILDKNMEKQLTLSGGLSSG